MIRLPVREGPNVRDQTAFCAFHSLLVVVQTNASYNLDPGAFLRMTAREGSTGFENDAGLIFFFIFFLLTEIFITTTSLTTLSLQNLRLQKITIKN